MKIKPETRELHGWDDEKIYFWDKAVNHRFTTKEKNKEWCVSDYEELYHQLVEICREYFNKKAGKGDRVK